MGCQVSPGRVVGLLALTMAGVLATDVRPSIAADARPVSPNTQPASRPVPLTAGDHRRELVVDGRPRSYLIHVPPGYDRRKPTPVVLAFHGAFMNAGMMPGFTGLSGKSDRAGFVVVYPNGTGVGEAVLFFNASAEPAADGPPDDVKFTAAMLDDLATVVTVDPTRTFATGMSNGGMMCHRLAAEMSDRIAAIAPVGGTLAVTDLKPKRPVPVIHFHGSADTVVPWGGPKGRTPANMMYQSVDATIKAWVAADGCPDKPRGVSRVADAAGDGTTVETTTFGPGRGGAEVVLVKVVGGGHTWPGRDPRVDWIGKSTHNLSANDVLWAFFERHPMR